MLEIASPELWNTENPYLYKLILETENEVIVDHIALRKIEIKDQVIYLNGQKINSVVSIDMIPIRLLDLQ